ncbi:GNAT family N-acetyltransferase [Rhodococcus sp. NPDC049939]|uniref:GNAT family N-acetyltransferase n=1 Tax=Rhodococcus sp. NPDC049939 TaxID=3155511 RepID=UPI0033FCB255
MTVEINPAGIWDSEAIADVAAATFPLACPPHATQDDVATFIDDVLSAERFSEYLTDPNRTVLKVTHDGSIVGYAMLIAGEPSDPELGKMVSLRPTQEISKLYVLPGSHGTGVASAMMDAIVERAAAAGCAGLWLGVNQQNIRAQKFYEKHGFVKVGTRTFGVGTQLHHDFVMQRAV